MRKSVLENEWELLVIEVSPSGLKFEEYEKTEDFLSYDHTTNSDNFEVEVF